MESEYNNIFIMSSMARPENALFQNMTNIFFNSETQIITFHGDINKVS